MNTGQLESFIQVAENLNFARAAEFLNVTTSAVSRQIRSLEEELDTKLLRRTTKSVQLTPAGIIFYNDAKEILAKLQLTTKKIKYHSEANIQILSIGYTTETAPYFINQLLRRCKEQLPEIHPFLRIVPTRLLLNMLIHDEIDILFGFKDDVPMRDSFLYHELAQFPVCYVLPTAHPLSQKEEISETDLLSESIVICNSHEIPSQVAGIQNLLSHRFSPNSIYYAANLPALLSLIQAGYGIGILPEMLSTDSSLTCVPLNPKQSLSYGIFYKNTNKNPVLKKFLSLIKDAFYSSFHTNR